MDQGIQERKIKPFKFYIDGYFSVAEEVVSIWKNSRGFTLTEYEGQDEFYYKYYDYYAVLLEQVIQCGTDKSEADIECLNSLTEFLEQHIKQGTATLTMFFHAYSVIMWHIDKCNGEKKVNNDQKRCVAGGFESIKRLMTLYSADNLTVVPLISPRGVYGINTFLYMYFNGLFPVGITTNPIVVHGVELGTSATKNIEHDLSHYSVAAAEDYTEEYPVYRYILNNQKEIGADKCAGLLFILFFMIHEVGGYEPESSVRIVKHYWYDWWKFLISNKYYTPEYFGIVFPKEYRMLPIDITDNESKGFRIAMTNDGDFYENVYKFITKFVQATHEDYELLKRQLAA